MEPGETILKDFLKELFLFLLKKNEDMEQLNAVSDMINKIMDDAVSSAVDKAVSDNKRSDKLLKAITYVKDHLAESPSLRETAEYLHISASYLSKIFIAHLHMPYSAFVLNEKIRYAKKLLANTDARMAEIAKKAGFSSSTYFSDCFKRMTGMSPLQFRKAYGSYGAASGACRPGTFDI